MPGRYSVILYTPRQKKKEKKSVYSNYQSNAPFEKISSLHIGEKKKPNKWNLPRYNVRIH